MPAPAVIHGPPVGLPFEGHRVGSSPGALPALPISGGKVSLLSYGDAIAWCDRMLGAKGTLGDYRLAKGITSATLFIYASGGSALVTFTFGVAGPATNYVTAFEAV